MHELSWGTWCWFLHHDWWVMRRDSILLKFWYGASTISQNEAKHLDYFWSEKFTINFEVPFCMFENTFLNRDVVINGIRVFGVSHFSFHRKGLALQNANSVWLPVVQKIRAVRFVYYCFCWYVCICNYTMYLCLSSLLQNESTFFILISFFRLPAEWSERSAFIFSWNNSKS